MRVAVLGGTRFIGRAITLELSRAGHQVAVFHRGNSEPEELAHVGHVHVDRSDIASVAGELADADAIVDTMALSGSDTEPVLEVLPRQAKLLVLSSMDVYEAYAALQAGTVTEPVPSDEESPVRAERYPYRGQIPGMDDYEKLDVEELYLRRGGTVCRLPMVYGEHDGQRREWFILRRVQAGRKRIPIGAGTWLSTRAYVGDVATGVRLALESSETDDQVFNLGERRTPSVALWARMILDAAGSDAELVTVPDAALPEDLGLTTAIAQHLVCDSTKARTMLGWDETDPMEALRRSVAWHLAHPPADNDAGFDGDDQALAAVDG
jgi:nucleoside-diphosphate-sugar epimerase